MKFLKNYLVICFILIFSCSNDDSNENPNNPDSPLAYQEIFNISYGSDAKQNFDLYLPAGRNQNTKVMFIVHGGSWVGGDKADMADMVNYMRQEFPNIAIANINYKLAGSGVSPYPMQLNDITAIVNHLKENQANYAISNQYGFIGVSAGAHLSLLWSYAFDLFHEVEMVCSIVGPTNFTDPNYLNDPLAAGGLIYFGINPTDTALLETMSPYHQLTASSPPTLLFYGGMDELIPTSQGEDLNEKLQLLNVPHEFTLYPNEGHGWTGTNLLDTYQKATNFIATHFSN